MRINNKTINKVIEYILHVLTWAVTFFFPHFRPGKDGVLYTMHIWPNIAFPLTLMIIFYVNYLWMVPKLFFRKKYNTFVLLNISAYILFTILLTFAYTPKHLESQTITMMLQMHTIFKLRDIANYLLITALATVLHMSFRFRKAEEEKQQSELKYAEAELRNLKNQVSPHFLLNTLNNIYALVSFDPEKSKEAIRNLSSLLRHMLYQNNTEFTSLETEVKFLQDYIELMKLRVSDKVKVELNVNIANAKLMEIAPLLYISLVENAFKHGITGDEGHISITIEADKESGKIRFNIRNSNHPKSNQDKSGSGVGLQLVQKRLDLIYEDKYQWKHGVDEKKNEYYSDLTINTK